MKWIRPNERQRCSYLWLCPYCKGKVYFISGANGKRLKDKDPKCKYKYCPHCGKEVEE